MSTETARTASPDHAEGVLITGVYGSGKSSVAAEMAELLERRQIAYGAIDLDWLMWFDVPAIEHDEAQRVFLDNVRHVTRTYRDAGVRRLVLALSVAERSDLDALRAAVGVRLTVVRLEVPLAEITRRLSTDPTTGRRDDLARAQQWLEDSIGVGLEDLVIANEGPVLDVARRIVEWLGWTAPAPR